MKPLEFQQALKARTDQLKIDNQEINKKHKGLVRDLKAFNSALTFMLEDVETLSDIKIKFQPVIEAGMSGKDMEDAFKGILQELNHLSSLLHRAVLDTIHFSLMNPNKKATKKKNAKA